jgi:hypothetical protein
MSTFQSLIGGDPVYPTGKLNPSEAFPCDQHGHTYDSISSRRYVVRT